MNDPELPDDDVDPDVRPAVPVAPLDALAPLAGCRHPVAVIVLLELPLLRDVLVPLPLPLLLVPV